MPRKPRAAPRVAPTAALGYGAAPVATATDVLAVLLPEAERIGVCTAVEFPLADGYALTLDKTGVMEADTDAEAETEEEVDDCAGADEDAEGVGVAEATALTGYNEGNMFFTSEGRAWYHAGVWPAAMDEAISAAKADDEANA
jgi:hypothetical protein